MNINISKSINLPCIKPLYDTWGAKSDAGCWSIDIPYDFSGTSIKERNTWYADTLLLTVDAFTSLARINLIYFSSIGNPKTRLEGKSFSWKLDEPYDDFLKKVSETIREYPADIYAIHVHLDLFVYIYTKESPDKRRPMVIKNQLILWLD